MIRFSVRMMTKLSKYIALLVLIGLVIFLSIRSYISLSGPSLSIWHMYVPKDLNASQIDSLTWQDYMREEVKLFQEVEENVVQKIAKNEQLPFNRYYTNSATNPKKFAQDWNRSYQLIPTNQPIRGSVVLLHGLTDTPYSLRHVASHYYAKGFAIVAIRLPGHGTVPSALTRVRWHDWVAATHLAVREANRIAPEQPLYMVGFSNGGALAVKYALDTLERPDLPKVERIILISPMIGITAYARFAGIAGWPSIFPGFIKTAWLGIVPEFNPFKYNSFPVNAARESFQLTRVLQAQINHLEHYQKLQFLPPILTFQSVMDATVSTRAIIASLYNKLSSVGNEIILFDLNRSKIFQLLIRHSAYHAIDQILPSLPRPYTTSVVTNQSSTDNRAVVFKTEAYSMTTQQYLTDVHYPQDVFSLSHVALPFPEDDSLYGKEPKTLNEFGISLGVFTATGENGVLIVSSRLMQRVTSNPFFNLMLNKMDEWIIPRSYDD